MKKILFLFSFLLLLTSLSAELYLTAQSQENIPFLTIYPNELSSFFLTIENSSSQNTSFSILIESQNKFLFSYPSTSKTYSQSLYLPANNSTKKQIQIQNISLETGKTNLEIKHGKDFNTLSTYNFPIYIIEPPLKISFLQTPENSSTQIQLYLKNDSNSPISNIQILPITPQSLIFESQPLLIPEIPPNSTMTTPALIFTPLKRASDKQEILFTISYTDINGNHTFLFNQEVEGSQRQLYLLALAILVIFIAIATLFVNKKRQK